MIKLFEDIYDKFTDKEYNFSVKEENANEVLDMLQKSTLHCKIFNSKLITNVITLYSVIEENKAIFNISITLKKSEWTRLLSLCTDHNYQLIVKEDKNIMCFVKKES